MTNRKLQLKKGFTLVEIMIVAICLAILMGPLFLILRSGTKTSLKGMLRIETTLEARRVIKQIHADLKLACFPLPYNSVYDFGDVMQISGTPPEVSYKFLSYPIHTEIGNVFTSQTSGKNYREVAEVKYTIEENSDPDKASYRLVREEKFNGKTRKQVLSERVNFFEIKPIMLQPQGKNQYYYLVTLQLLDAVHAKDMEVQITGDKITDQVQDVILADFYDVVYPEFFHSMWNQVRVNPNWHTPLKAPGS
jgi:prepilin-type N-terminal cleavage/methylation domain-containing protein